MSAPKHYDRSAWEAEQMPHNGWADAQHEPDNDSPGKTDPNAIPAPLAEAMNKAFNPEHVYSTIFVDVNDDDQLYFWNADEGLVYWRWDSVLSSTAYCEEDVIEAFAQGRWVVPKTHTPLSFYDFSGLRDRLGWNISFDIVNHEPICQRWRDSDSPVSITTSPWHDDMHLYYLQAILHPHRNWMMAGKVEPDGESV